VGGRGRLAWVLAAALLVAVWAVAAFLQAAEARLAALPAQIRAEAAARGDPYVPLADIPPDLQHAVVAVEDRSFYTNWGISLEGLVRAAWVDLVERRFAQGGSTITQELVRDQLLGPQKTVGRKLLEIAYALLAARRFPKPLVLEMFLNQAYFGHGAYGVAAAARTYFGLRPRDLSLGQDALLAGLLQAPTDLDPLVHPQAALARQAVVLAAMVDAGYLTPAQAQAAARQPLLLLPAGS
jgi:membrane peptidoglycan carboxypeptidase